jgi:fatty-acyl-CoA synthase
LTSTPTAPDRHTRNGDFATLADALDFAAAQPTGINLHSLRGELTQALTYAELAASARDLAGALLALGLEPGDRVAMAAESDADFLNAFFACQYAGLTPVPLPLPAPFGGKDAYLAHVRRMFQAAGAKAAFAPPALVTWFEEAADGLGLTFTGSVGTVPSAPFGSLPQPDPEGLCYLQFSSGSTRFPKGVAVTQKALMANIGAIGREGLGVGPADRTVTWLPLFHDMGLVGMLLTSVAFQVSIDLLPTGAFVRRPKLWLDLISSRGGTISYAPTFGYDLAARRAGGSVGDDLDLSRWRVAGLGGDMIRAEPLRAFADAYEPAGFDARAFVASYGMAEATLALTLTPPGRGLRTDTIDLDSLEHELRAEKRFRGGRSREFALCGEPLAGHSLEVRTDDGAVLPERGVGRIFASGPSLMKTYLGEPEETAKVLSADGWLDTGDIGYFLDGQIVITGRAKDLIIVNGRNVWPQDLEWTAEKGVPGLRNGDVAVFSAAVDEGEERVIALVQVRGIDEAARRAVCADVASLLRSRHGLEVAVTAVPPHSLPQTSSGKLSRSRAKMLYLGGAFSATPSPVPAGE